MDAEQSQEVRAMLEEVRAATDEALKLHATIEEARAAGANVVEDEAHLLFHLRTIGEALIRLASGAT